MANIRQPLLDRPRGSYSRDCPLIFTLVLLICLAALVAIPLVRFSSFDANHPYKYCERAVDQKSCSALLSEVASKTTVRTKGVDLLHAFLERSASDIQNVINQARNFNDGINNRREQASSADCLELMELSRDRIMDSMVGVEKQDVNWHSNAQAWLSSVLTNHVTCLDGLQGSVRTLMEPGLSDLISKARTSLAILVSVSPTKTEFDDDPLTGGFPSWLSSKDRKLLQALPNEIKADVVVAKDGSGNYKTLGEAVATAPDKSKTRYIIHVKKGTYKENVEIGANKKNLMIVGDGMNSTIITGSLNVIDGSTTFKSATVAAVGDGFMAQDIWFQNTAGPQKHQAVAIRVGADQSVINRCKIDAYQDTLYAHSNRQFYRDSYVTGTVDFIFGNAAVVFQNCKLVARKPMNSQSNMVTAQGRLDPNQNTGTSIQNCNILASADLEPVKGSIKSYLGRPWKEYSRTVVMQSYIGDHIDPSGWSVWSEDFALKTLYYGEYMNRGPEADTSKRVKWPGFHVITSAEEAKKFTVAELIQGGSWLKSTGVTFKEWL
ncbi:hypothetical protein ERO13_D05G171600v2 [Gossypium hirsutum]|uniref:Pectinesterase n=1 Tax=Gossypium hirsutum TaxID=3635 RepID=A0A1U8JHV1_GOSHI|nr:pectinesterase-like [Gossypium hirsutum]KAG4146646.1 hypothetical protein ERO13_D05G171600v2 [Gossypium hirsutum]